MTILKASVKEAIIKLGFWIRISFSNDPLLLKEAINRFIFFKRDYIKNEDKYIYLNKSFL